MSIRIPLVRGVAVAAVLTLVPLGGVAHAAGEPPPSPVTALAVYTHVGSVTVAWTPPTSADLHDSVVQVRPGTAAPRTVLDGVLRRRSGNTFVPSLVVPKTDNVATVDGLDPGTDYTIGVFARDPEGNVSPVTSKTVHGADLTLAVSSGNVAYGQATRFTARLTRSTGPAALAGQPVDFYVRAKGTRPWFFLHESRTDARGYAAATFTPGVNIEVQAYFFGSPTALGTAVTGPAVLVRQQLVAVAAKKKLKRGKKFTIRGTVTSRTPSRTVLVDRYSKGAWRPVAKVGLTNRKTVRTTTTGRFTYSFRIKKKSKRSYRVRLAATSQYALTTSRTVKVRAT